MSIDQPLLVDKILKELKDVRIPASTVEKELGIAAGYLWKVKDGRKRLSEETLAKLTTYYELHKKPEMILPTVIKNVHPKSAPKKEGAPAPQPGSLAAMMAEINADTKRVIGTPYKRSKV